jgi:hypothetical protein
MLKIARDTTTGGRKLTFFLPADHAGGAISVVGNFNDWTPGVHVLARRGATRSAGVVLPADYIAAFRYLGEDGLWFDEPEASFVDAGASVVLPPVPVKKPGATRKATAKSAASAPAKAAATTPTKAAARKAAAPRTKKLAAQ